MSERRLDLAAWTVSAVHAECGAAYALYSRKLDKHYAGYFAAHPEERGAHPRQAADIDRALPPGYGRLAEQMPRRVRHIHHLSGRSSQILILAVFGVSAECDPSLSWLNEGLLRLPPIADLPELRQFEYELPPDALNEQAPRVTSIDLLVRTKDLVVCIEAKRGEDGMGRCNCPSGASLVADCSEKVLNRPLYWQTEHELFGMPERQPGRACPLSLGYQAIRSVAAARYLASSDRVPVFGLVYDAENPYFAGAGAWPGWPRVLEHTLRSKDDRIRFRSVSWQELIPRLPIDESFRAWLREKHRLEGKVLGAG